MLRLDVTGNLGSDAEIKNVNGKEFVTFDVAHNESFTNAAGEKINKTTWVNCIAKRTNVTPFLKKGTLVFLSGVPNAKAYLSNQDSQPRASLNLTVRNIELLSGSKDNQQNNN